MNVTVGIAFALGLLALLVYVSASTIALRADDTFGAEYAQLKRRYWRLGLLAASLAGIALLVGKGPAAGAGAVAIVLFGIVGLPIHTSDFLKSAEEHERKNPDRETKETKGGDQ